MGLVQALAFQLSELVFMDLTFRSSVKKMGQIPMPPRCIHGTDEDHKHQQKSCRYKYTSPMDQYGFL